MEVYLWMYFKAYLQTQCLFAWRHGKIKRNQPRPQIKNCRPPQVWFILGSNFQNAWRYHVHLYKQYDHVTIQASYHSGRRRVLSPRDEHTLVQKVQINPRTTAKDLVKMLEETGTKVSISTVKTRTISTWPERPLSKEEATAQNAIRRQTTVCNSTWRQRLYFLEKCPLVWWNNNSYVWP